MGYAWPKVRSTFTRRRLIAAGLIPFHLGFIVGGLVIAVYTIVLTKSMSAFSDRIIAKFGYFSVVYMYLTAVCDIAVHAFGIKVRCLLTYLNHSYF